MEGNIGMVCHEGGTSFFQITTSWKNSNETPCTKMLGDNILTRVFAGTMKSDPEKNFIAKAALYSSYPICYPSHHR